MPRGTWAATRSKYRSRTTTSRRSTCGRMSSTKSGTTICYLSRSHNNDQVIFRRLLTVLQRALRKAPDGLPGVSTRTIWCVLQDAGYTWQADRSWCHTGHVVRVRKDGPVEVHDPDTVAKKT